MPAGLFVDDADIQRMCPWELKMPCQHVEGGCVCVYGPVLHIVLPTQLSDPKLFCRLKWCCRDVYVYLSDALILWKGE